jgi:molecular chaperone DnaJ
MTKSPYEVLGVSPDATQDEIKRAYRKKARENHPDLNPNDPNASQRMNEINEAYDRLTNPQKYAREDRRRAASQAASGYGSAGQGRPGYSGAGTRGGQTREGYTTGPSSGPYNWGSPGFGWDDFFGFGFSDFQASDPRDIHPEATATDSAQVRGAIDLLNAGRYREAAQVMASIPGSLRDARWYYIAALANWGAGNTTLGYEQMLRAVSMDPSNQTYRAAYQAFRQPSEQYEQAAQTRGFSTGTAECLGCCLGLTALNLCMSATGVPGMVLCL